MLAPCGYSIGSSKATPVHEHRRGLCCRERPHRGFVPRGLSESKALTTLSQRTVDATSRDPTMPTGGRGQSDGTGRAGGAGVANITVGFGALLVLLGVGFFAATGFEHVTAPIPAVLGLVLGLLGTLAR